MYFEEQKYRLFRPSVDKNMCSFILAVSGHEAFHYTLPLLWGMKRRAR